MGVRQIKSNYTSIYIYIFFFCPEDKGSVVLGSYYADVCPSVFLISLLLVSHLIKKKHDCELVIGSAGIWVGLLYHGSTSLSLLRRLRLQIVIFER